MNGYRYVLECSYLGAGYVGWQRQAKGATVQAALEEALASVVGQAVTVAGAGRTDAGVHARAQWCHFDCPVARPLAALALGTNRGLPSDIRVHAAARVDRDFHARYSVVTKEYRYRLSRRPVISALDASQVAAAPRRLVCEPMREAAQEFVGHHDFAAFSKRGVAVGNTRRTIRSIEVLEQGPEVEVRVIGDGFLRGMVRLIVGTLVDVGRGRLQRAQISEALVNQGVGPPAAAASARGLTLHAIDYGPNWVPLDELRLDTL